MFYTIYEQWLITKINKSQIKKYNKLLHHLHCTPFRWSIKNDDSREIEGAALRSYFCYDSIKYFDTPEVATVLEVLIVLSDRCSWILEGHPKGLNSSQCFWLMMKNLGLVGFTDDKYDSYSEFIADVLTNFLDRTYDFYGRGGLFPLKNSKEDQRCVELWYQMNTYLLENYY